MGPKGACFPPPPFLGFVISFFKLAVFRMVLCNHPKDVHVLRVCNDVLLPKIFWSPLSEFSGSAYDHSGKTKLQVNFRNLPVYSGALYVTMVLFNFLPVAKAAAWKQLMTFSFNTSSSLSVSALIV